MPDFTDPPMGDNWPATDAPTKDWERVADQIMSVEFARGALIAVSVLLGVAAGAALARSAWGSAALLGLVACAPFGSRLVV